MGWNCFADRSSKDQSLFQFLAKFLKELQEKRHGLENCQSVNEISSSWYKMHRMHYRCIWPVVTLWDSQYRELGRSLSFLLLGKKKEMRIQVIPFICSWGWVLLSWKAKNWRHRLLSKSHYSKGVRDKCFQSKHVPFPFKAISINLTSFSSVCTFPFLSVTPNGKNSPFLLKDSRSCSLRNKFSLRYATTFKINK